MFLSGEEIYNNFQQGAGGAQLGHAAGLVAELSQSYNAQADEIKRLAGVTEAVWKGEASGAAQRGLGPLAVEHALAAPELATAQDLTTRQVGSFEDARNAVVPVPPKPDKVAPLSAFITPGVFATYGEQLRAHKAAAEHNVDVMRRYESASLYNTNMPQSYGQITGDQSEIRVASQDSPGTGDRPHGPGPGRGGPPVGGGQPGSGGSGSGTGGSGTGGVAAGPVVPVGEGAVVVSPPQHGTDPGGYGAPPAARVPGGGPGSGVSHGVNPDGGLLGGGEPGVGVGPIGVPEGGVGSGGRGSAGVGGIPGSGGPGAGGRPGAGPVGEPIAGQGSGTRPAGTPRGPIGGVPMSAGAGKGRGADDEEYERASYLHEPDPENVFGTKEISAPPVIGGQP